jgi:hypothetical protein
VKYGTKQQGLHVALQKNSLLAILIIFVIQLLVCYEMAAAFADVPAIRFVPNKACAVASRNEN